MPVYDTMNLLNVMGTICIVSLFNVYFYFQLEPKVNVLLCQSTVMIHDQPLGGFRGQDDIEIHAKNIWQ